MPLAVGPSAAVTPTIEAPSAPVVVWTNEPIGTIRATWIDPGGTEWQLSGPHEKYGWFTRTGIAGWGANPVTIVTDPLARGGVTVRHQRQEPRRLTWPLHIYGDTHMEWLGRYRALMRAFTMTKYLGAGTLRVARPDGSAREIQCYYEDGFAGEPDENLDFANPTLTLFCPQGLWRDVEPQRVRREYANAGNPYLAPYPTVVSGQVLGDTTITNDGDVPAYANWTITGPATQLTARNNTTGQQFVLTYTLNAGQQATITMTPERPLVRGPGGVNIVGSLNWPGATLWSLQPGSNDVTFTLSGSAPGTAIELSYYRLYEAS